MATVQLQALPTDLFMQIASLCDFHDWKNLRIAIPRAPQSDAILPYLFEDYYMGYSTLHLKKLEQATQNDIIARSVKRFIFDIELVPEVDSQGWWYRQTMPRSHSHLQHDDVELKKALDSTCEQYHNFREFSHDQRKLMPRQDVAFQIAFQRLVGLQHVTCVALQLAGNNTRPPWKGLLPLVLIGPDSWSNSEHFYKFRESMPNIRHRPVAALIRAIDYRATQPDVRPLSSVELINVGYDALAQQPAFALDSVVPDYAGFHNLISFSLRLLWQWANDQGDHPHPSLHFERPENQLDELKSILPRFTRLKKLHLEFQDETNYYLQDAWRGYHSMDDLAPLADVTLPSLEHIKLSAMFMGQTLLEFLHRHRNTITEVSLVDSALINATASKTWVKIINEMHLYAPIEHFYFERLSDIDSWIGAKTLTWFVQGVSSRHDDPRNVPVVNAVLGKQRLCSTSGDENRARDLDPQDWTYIENH